MAGETSNLGLGDLSRRQATSSHEPCYVLVGPIFLIHVAKNKLNSQENTFCSRTI